MFNFKYSQKNERKIDLKRVLFVISKLTGGGAERALCNLTLGFPEDLIVDIMVNSESDYDYPHKGNVISLGMPHRNNLSLFYQMIAFVKRYFKLVSLKKSGNYDMCISFLDSANIVNVLTGKKKCKIILSVRNNLSESKSKSYKFLVHPLAKLLYGKADKVVSLSEGVAEDLVKNFNLRKENICTIYNGYDIDNIVNRSEEKVNFTFENDTFYFVTVGRMCEQKGQWHLIRAFSKVAKKYNNCKLIICGKGEYRKMLQSLVKECGIEDSVIFAGFQKNPYAISRKCNVFVFPSMYEGFGNVIIENMICGLPVIATDFRSGAREILAPDTDYNVQQKNSIEYAQYGVIVPVCNSTDKDRSYLDDEESILADAMIELMINKELYENYKIKSVERAKDFSIDVAVNHWMDLFEKNSTIN